ncbi:MAG: Transcriptional regulatory protein YycF [Syntrophus sp. PtaU1.Bin005]|jgi:sigma-B regulation protein RsbU (phosphoserine phosphatase)|uniref:PP2C family protein-serine/threonine phosphatase n=1 Tax=Syntrophus TaxID=43773 RepID=UPI0009CF01EB|nr:MAG: Transcriptional regulatory protein YycF [Syntrophus sp. PtaB.Bin138]OPY81116.1 MAG: Transcriptional regulatory protein YycF [Syntrophus sp. PtaU1.Bin005]
MRRLKDRILIIDDSLDFRALLARLLKASGFEMMEAESGEEGLQKIGEFQPDLILLDIMMPGIDGYEVCERIKADPCFRDIPIIFLSGRTDAADKIRGLAIGGADYITKPFDRGEVIARIENQLKIRRLTDELIATNAELTEKQKKLDEDLQAAAGIQQNLLPRNPPEVDNLDIAWKFMPSEQIGGDIFNVLRLDEDHLGFYMIDVSGHGVPPALVTFSISQTLQPHMGCTIRKRPGFTPDHQVVSPGEVLKSLDEEYPWERFERFLTIIYLIVNIRNGHMIYSNAAHPPPILLHADGALELLEEGGTIIGLDGILPFEEGEKILSPGDKIILYTDGVFEFVDSRGEIFGEKRFHELVKGLYRLPIGAVLDEIVLAIERFVQGAKLQDDVSLLGIEFKNGKCQ